jgi:protease II
LDPVSALRCPESALATHEYEEFGDPTDPVLLEYLHSYSPYDCLGKPPELAKMVKLKERKFSHGSSSCGHPAVLISTGLNDVRVCPSEAVNWAEKARLNFSCGCRREKVLLHISETAGHDGPQDIEEQIELVSLETSFLECAVGFKCMKETQTGGTILSNTPC